MLRLVQLTFSILFPFVQQMIVDTGEVKVENVGYAVGLVEASFSWTQFFSRTSKIPP